LNSRTLLQVGCGCQYIVFADVPLGIEMADDLRGGLGTDEGRSSSSEAFAIRSMEPRERSSFIFLFSPIPGISASSEEKSRFSRRLR
jgi:hypothetical protein